LRQHLAKALVRFGSGFSSGCIERPGAGVADADKLHPTMMLLDSGEMVLCYSAAASECEPNFAIGDSSRIFDHDQALTM
jgi:hypothetical protein